MATNFKDLPQQEQLSAVKDRFVQLLADVAIDRPKLANYLPKPTDPGESATDEQKTAFKAASEHYQEVEKILGNAKLAKDCICGECLEPDIGKEMPKALKFLVKVARDEAEKASY
jgi:hypothetical protein